MYSSEDLEWFDYIMRENIFEKIAREGRNIPCFDYIFPASF